MDTATRGILTEARRHLRSALFSISELERLDRLAEQLADNPTTREQWNAFGADVPEEPAPPAPTPWEEPDLFSPEWYARHPEMQCVTVILRVRGGQTSAPDIRIYPGDGSPIRTGRESESEYH